MRLSERVSSRPSCAKLFLASKKYYGILGQNYVYPPASTIFLSLFLALLVDGDKVTQYTVGLERLVVHLRSLVRVAAHDGQAIVMRLHHGLVGPHLGEAGDLDQAPGHELAGVDTIVVYPYLPRLGPDRLSFLGGGLGVLFVGNGWPVEDCGSGAAAHLHCRTVQGGGHHGYDIAVHAEG